MVFMQSSTVVMYSSMYCMLYICSVRGRYLNWHRTFPLYHVGTSFQSNFAPIIICGKYNYHTLLLWELCFEGDAVVKANYLNNMYCLAENLPQENTSTIVSLSKL